MPHEDIINDDFQTMVMEFTNLYDRKAEYRRIVSGINKKVKDLEKKIESYMSEHDLEGLDTGDGGILSLTCRKRTAPINKVNIKEILSTFPKFQTMPNKDEFLDSLIEYLYENRKKTETVALKRTKKSFS